MSLVDEVLTGIEGSDCPGAVVAVSENGARSSGARGLAQLGTLEQLGIDTVCYVASVAKQFTAAASLRAAQAGRLTLTDSVGHWVPGLPRWAQELTVEHLLRHTSGLHDYNDILAFGGLEAGSAFGREAVLNQLQRQDRPGFGAGTRYDYSNSNYVLAALIVERATDTDFAAFVAEELFDPLGMGRTTFGAPALGEDRAVGYEPEGESWKVSDAVPGTAGDGGLWSTAADLRTWLQALHGGGVDPQIRAGLLAASLLDGGPALGFGRASSAD